MVDVGERAVITTVYLNKEIMEAVRKKMEEERTSLSRVVNWLLAQWVGMDVAPKPPRLGRRYMKKEGIAGNGDDKEKEKRKSKSRGRRGRKRKERKPDIEEKEEVKDQMEYLEDDEVSSWFDNFSDEALRMMYSDLKSKGDEEGARIVEAVLRKRNLASSD
ncbi:MAG: hypothetical protein DRN78_02200 [Thermoproteota archaeon]|nr:MAG: hypothetical protein DRN78_02200 [Candidatus Korarchaeota archaeon]